MLTQTLRSRWFAALVHAGLWLMLVLAVAALGARAPRFGETSAPSSPAPDPIPTARIQTLFNAIAAPGILNDTNLLNPFFTRYFLPPVLPPPTTRKVELTYHGFIETADGSKTALIKVGDVILPVMPGAKAVADLAVADATWQTLTLTNAAAQTNLLLLNAKKEVVVPVQ